MRHYFNERLTTEQTTGICDTSSGEGVCSLGALESGCYYDEDCEAGERDTETLPEVSKAHWKLDLLRL